MKTMTAKQVKALIELAEHEAEETKWMDSTEKSCYVLGAIKMINTINELLESKINDKDE